MGSFFLGGPPGARRLLGTRNGRGAALLFVLSDCWRCFLWNSLSLRISSRSSLDVMEDDVVLTVEVAALEGGHEPGMTRLWEGS